MTMLAFALLFAASLRLSRAVDVYLAPSLDLYSSSLSVEAATDALSRQLGLEGFEPFRDSSRVNYEGPFVGQGQKKTLLLTMHESEAQAVLPSTLRPAFHLVTPPVESLDSVVSTYLTRARRNFGNLFESFNFGSISDVQSLLTFFQTADVASFAAINLSGIQEKARTYGRDSGEYRGVTDNLRGVLEEFLQSDDFSLAVLTYPSPISTSHVKRQDTRQTQSPLPPNTPSPQHPIGGVSTCFTTLDACNNVTSSCSGRGSCVEASKSGRTCFVCNCGVTTTGEGKSVKTSKWAGESCERKDISGPFVLITGTVIAILLLIVGSVSLLYSVGNQLLPSTLLATAVHSKRE